jgi:hypothetical protein
MEEDIDLAVVATTEIGFHVHHVEEDLRGILARLMSNPYAHAIQREIVGLVHIANRLSSLSLECFGEKLTEEEKKSGRKR